MIEDETRQPANPANPERELAPLAGLAECPTAPRDAQGRFQTGNSGGGRPKGAKNKLTDVLLSVVVEDFMQYGADALARLRSEDPGLYLRLVCALVPRELILKREQEPATNYAELTFEEAGALIDSERQRRIIARAIELG